MDAIDWNILRALKENGRATASQISGKVRLSVPAVAERIRKLERAEVIEQYTIRIKRSKTPYTLLAFIFVALERTKDVAAFREEIVRQPCVLECHHVAGEYDYLLKVLVEDAEGLERFLMEVLKELPGVAKSNTILSLSTLKEEHNLL